MQGAGVEYGRVLDPRNFRGPEVFHMAATANRATSGAFTLNQLNGALVGVSLAFSAGTARIRIREKDGSGRVLCALMLGGHFPFSHAVPYAGGLYVEVLAGTMDDIVVHYI